MLGQWRILDRREHNMPALVHEKCISGDRWLRNKQAHWSEAQDSGKRLIQNLTDTLLSHQYHKNPFWGCRSTVSNQTHAKNKGHWLYTALYHTGSSWGKAAP